MLTYMNANDVTSLILVVFILQLEIIICGLLFHSRENNPVAQRALVERMNQPDFKMIVCRSTSESSIYFM